MSKSPKGRKSKIQSDYPLERITPRISREAITILKQQPNASQYIDEAIKEKFSKTF